MAYLKDLLASILHSIIEAQNASDCLSAKIADRYATSALLRTLPVPNAQMTEIELDLKFAISESTVSESTVSDTPEASPSNESSRKHLVSEAANRMADDAIRLVGQALSDQKDSADDAEKWTTVQESIRSETFRRHLMQQVHRVLTSQQEQGTSSESHEDATLQQALQQVERQLFDNPALREWLEPGGYLRKSLTRDVRGSFSRHLEQARRPRMVAPAAAGASDLQIIVDARELQDLPAHAVQTMKVKLVLNHGDWVVA